MHKTLFIHIRFRVGTPAAALADGLHGQAGAGVRACSTGLALHLPAHPQHPLQIGGRCTAGEAVQPNIRLEMEIGLAGDGRFDLFGGPRRGAPSSELPRSAGDHTGRPGEARHVGGGGAGRPTRHAAPGYQTLQLARPRAAGKPTLPGESRKRCVRSLLPDLGTGAQPGQCWDQTRQGDHEYQ